MHGHDRAGVLEVEQEVSVRDRVEGVLDHAGKAEVARGHLAVERIARAGERRSAERVGVGGVEGGGKACEVALEHPGVGQQVVRKEHRLRVLQVRHAGKHGRAGCPGGVEKRATQAQVLLHKVLGERLGAEARVGGHLVVAAAPGVQARSRVADAARELGLDGHVDVFVVDVEGKVARIDVGLDAQKSLANGVGVLLADDALCREHRRVRDAPRDVLAVQRLVHRQRRAELLRELVDALLKPSTPQRHDALLS